MPANPINFCGNRLTYSATYRFGISACRYRLLNPRTIDLSTVALSAQWWSASAAGTARQTDRWWLKRAVRLWGALITPGAGWAGLPGVPRSNWPSCSGDCQMCV